RFAMVYLALIGGLGALFIQLPTSFLPDEDQGTMFLLISTPPGATAERTLESVKQAENYFLENEKEVEHLFTVTGFSFSGSGQNAPLGFVRLVDWEERPHADQSVFAV